LQKEYSNYQTPPKREDIWICEFCEYESIFGAPPTALIWEYERKDAAERKRLEERRRLLEKAKMKGRKGGRGKKGSKGKGGGAAQAAPVNTQQQGGEVYDDEEGEEYYEEGGGYDEHGHPIEGDYGEEPPSVPGAYPADHEYAGGGHEYADERRLREVVR
jgi:hypothetical protein